MRNLIFCCLLLACSGAPFEGAERADATGGAAGEAGATGGTETGGSGAVETGGGGASGSSGKATGGSSGAEAGSAGEDPGTGGTERGGATTGGSGGTAGCEQTTTFYLDEDGDGYGQDGETVEACEAPDGYAPEGGDCDDRPNRVGPELTNPGTPERCNGEDENCNGQADEGDACAAGCVGVEEGAPVFCTEPTTWEDADRACSDMGMTLLRLYWAIQNYDINLGREYWLGARIVDAEWTWTEVEEPVVDTGPPDAWADGQPTAGECMKYQDSNLGRRPAGWASLDCDATELPFACQPLEQ